MNTKKKGLGVIGTLLSESILFVEMGIDLYKGEMTCIELILRLAFCLMVAGFLSSLILRKNRKDRGG